MNNLDPTGSSETSRLNSEMIIKVYYGPIMVGLVYLQICWSARPMATIKKNGLVRTYQKIHKLV